MGFVNIDKPVTESSRDWFVALIRYVSKNVTGSMGLILAILQSPFSLLYSNTKLSKKKKKRKIKYNIGNSHNVNPGKSG